MTCPECGKTDCTRLELTLVKKLKFMLHCHRCRMRFPSNVAPEVLDAVKRFLKALNRRE